MQARRNTRELGCSWFLLAATCLTLASGRARAGCGWDSSPGKATLYAPQETWQDPSCPTCDPIPLLTLDAEGDSPSFIGIVSDKGGSCTGFKVGSVDVKSTLTTTVGGSCVDESPQYFWRVHRPGSATEFEIASEYRYENGTGIVVPGNDLRATEQWGKLPLFPVTGTAGEPLDLGLRR